MAEAMDGDVNDERLQAAAYVMYMLRQYRESGGTALDTEERLSSISARDLYLCHIDEITYEDKAPSREAIENIIGSFRSLEGISFVYMILGNRKGVRFYLGVVKDKSARRNALNMEINDIGRNILERSIRGNFRGCRLTVLDGGAKEEILHKLSHVTCAGVLSGVPGIEKDSRGQFQARDVQGTDRLIDVMSGEDFGYVVIAKPYTDAEIDEVERQLYEIHDLLLPMTKDVIQRTQTRKTDTAKVTDDIDSREELLERQEHSHTHDTVKSGGHNRVLSHEHHVLSAEEYTQDEPWSREHTEASIDNTNAHKDDNRKQENRISHLEDKSIEKRTVVMDNSLRKNHNTRHSSLQDNESSQTENHTSSEKTSDFNTNGSTHTKLKRENGQTTSHQEDSNTQVKFVPVEQREAQSWIRYIDEVLLPRQDNGRGKGLFLSAVYLFTNDSRAKLYRLANTAVSLFSGTKGNKEPLHFTEFRADEEVDDDCPFRERVIPSCRGSFMAFSNLQLPKALLPEEKQTELDRALAAVQSGKEVGESSYEGKWLSSDELGILAGFPQKEVIGLRLRKEVDFGLNVDTQKVAEKDRIELGKLVQCGEEKTPVYLDRKALDKHTFIAGTTGSGKTTTCQNILLDCGLPFLVIEPVKSEYRILKHQYPDIIYFTPGNQQVAPFFLNPFEIFPGESIASRAEMLKATIEASFDMDAAIPQILESAIYRAYEKKGWDVNANTWMGKTDENPDGPFSPTSEAFPTFGEYAQVVREEIEGKGFDQRLRDEYMGTINAMTASLLIGAKGQMLNTPKSVSFYDLVTKRVVIELDDIKTGSEKSLLMGFILTNLLAAVKAHHEECKKRGENFQHITLVEEAHRLLSKFEPGDNLNKRQGVEVFADMLAEVRKYGESMIIVDQIPSKMTPEVLKNTNTKIVHKLFAQDDKDAIGNTMALDQDQKAFLSNLTAGRAIVFSQDWPKAVQVQVGQKSNTTGEEVANAEIHEKALDFYSRPETVRSGVLTDLKIPADDVSRTEVKAYLDFLVHKDSIIRRLHDTLEHVGDGGKPEDFDTVRQLLHPYYCLGAASIAAVYTRTVTTDERYIKKDAGGAVQGSPEVNESSVRKMIDEIIRGGFTGEDIPYLSFLLAKLMRRMLKNPNPRDFNNSGNLVNYPKIKETARLLAKLGKTDEELAQQLYEEVYDENKLKQHGLEGEIPYLQQELRGMVKVLMTDETVSPASLFSHPSPYPHIQKRGSMVTSI